MRFPVLMAVPLLVALLCIPVSEAASSYLVTGQYTCRKLLCPIWSLDVSALTERFEIFHHEATRLIELIPPSPTSEVQFPFFTAFDNSTRRFYLGAFSRPRLPAFQWTLWTSALASDLSSATAPFPSSSVSFPSPNDIPVGLLSASSRLWAAYSTGNLQLVDPRTGAASLIANVLGSSTGTRFLRSGTTAVDAVSGRLFFVSQTFIGARSYKVHVYNTRTNVTTSAPIAPLRGLDFDVIEMFDLQWVPNLNLLLVFSTGNFDSVFYVNPLTGASSAAALDLANFGLQFMQQPSTFDDDIWDVSAYDNIDQKLFFQATTATETETTLLAEVPITRQEEWTYVNTALSPMSFGYRGMEFVACQGECHVPRATQPVFKKIEAIKKN